MARALETPRELFDRLTLQARRTARTPNAAQVHNLRVAIRRFSQALTLLPEDTGFKKLRRVLKKTMSQAGAVRDADIAVKLIAKLKPVGARGLQKRLARRRGQAEKRLLDSLPVLAQPVLSKRRSIGLPAAAGLAAREALVHAVKRLFKRGAKADDSKGLHRQRIAVKKLRYTLELIAPRAASLAPIKRLQSLLGAINDYATARHIVGEESGSKKLLGQIEDREHRKIRQFRRFWKSEFDGKDNHRRWLAELSHAEKAVAAGA